jgi:arginine/serine-rich splicing factor 4/5/6
MDREEAQVYIGYLPNQARMSDVEEFFKGFGHIKSINLKPGYGFVVFEDRRDAEEAARVSRLFAQLSVNSNLFKDLDGKRMCGEKVDVEIAKGPGNKSRKESSRYGDRPVVRDTRSGFNGRRRSRSRDRGFVERSDELFALHTF